MDNLDDPTIRTLAARYTEHYRAQVNSACYPTEFVVRTLMGQYPDLTWERSYTDKTLLDLGFGDGRNMPLFHNLGARVHGIEISPEICALAGERMQNLGIPCDLRVGANHRTDFPTSFFDFVIASNSIHYLGEDKTIKENFVEVARILKPGGQFLFSAPMEHHDMLAGAERLPDNTYRIRQDPFRVRNGMTVRAFADEADIRTCLEEHFQAISIGHSTNNYFGLNHNYWIVACRRTTEVAEVVVTPAGGF